MSNAGVCSNSEAAADRAMHDPPVLKDDAMLDNPEDVGPCAAADRPAVAGNDSPNHQSDNSRSCISDPQVSQVQLVLAERKLPELGDAEHPQASQTEILQPCSGKPDQCSTPSARAIAPDAQEPRQGEMSTSPKASKAVRYRR